MTNDLIKRRKSKYLTVQRDVLLADDASRIFFKNAKAFRNGEKPREFDVRELMPEADDREVAEALADHFNAVSVEFSPLWPDQIPVARPKKLPILQPYEVSARLKAFRKPKTMVRGDLFPCLVTQCSDFLAIPFTDVFNCITDTKVCPAIWKREHVTVIPKKSVPASFNDLRNISCTMPISKVYESYVLNRASV